MIGSASPFAGLGRMGLDGGGAARFGRRTVRPHARPAASPFPHEDGRHEVPMTNREPRPVAAANKRFLSAMMKRRLAGMKAERSGTYPNPNSIFGASGDYERPIWRAVFEALQYYHHPWNWEGSRPIEAFPAEMAFAIAQGLGEMVGSGKIPATWKSLTMQSGRRGWGADDPRSAAVRYVRAAQSGDREIKDASPIKTICKHYCVTREAVRQWMRESNLTKSLSRDNLPPDAVPDLIALLMRKEGERFQAVKPHNRVRNGPV